MTRDAEIRRLIRLAREQGAFVTTADAMGFPMTEAEECSLLVEIGFVQVTGPKWATGAPMQPDEALLVLRAGLCPAAPHPEPLHAA